ncbi:predicted protein [Candida tropicalis MYA-3404]|uniref:Uncharacterized protein n=1 Tax=Candida tropicalis (strain ATCC MYA-3404 / T1) TaxID=294747 RepID=C5M1W0_CANTT|nr:predicted protein [Candida tropicalis MYA-3404]EER35310.1 predicted protein [Candida tropicalis MYA-3404]KAG4409414.1 hypothetical protein JTP64_000052 [Candida tropicalis]MCP8718321.1 hypothetical protein [Asgard group archaeon]
MSDYTDVVVVFKRKGGMSLWKQMYEVDDEFGVEFKIIDYESADEIWEFLDNNKLYFYIIQTKSNELRLQCTEFNRDFHRLVDNDDGEEEMFSICASMGNGPDDRIEEHMEESDHEECEIE